jgi:CDP-diacylglycerol--serine O-phosphatidyltransferase
LKLKDYVTLGNLLSGFAAVIALFLGSLEWGCYLIFIAYVFDVLDGPVARLTRQHDSFGSHLDTICDYITNSIAVSFVIFYAFWQRAHFPWWLAAGVAAFPAAFGTIRQARGMDHEVSYPCYWIGLPRPVLALFILAVINSSMFNLGVSPWQELAHGVAAAFVVVGSVLHLSKLPFVNHHERRWMGWLRFGKHFFLSLSPLVWLAGWLLLDWPGLVYDHLLACFFVYLFVSWTQIPRVDLERMRAYLRGEPKVLPLVHRSSAWRSRTWFDFFLVREAPPEADSPVEPAPAP